MLRFATCRRRVLELAGRRKPETRLPFKPELVGLDPTKSPAALLRSANIVATYLAGTITLPEVEVLGVIAPGTWAFESALEAGFVGKFK